MRAETGASIMVRRRRRRCLNRPARQSLTPDGARVTMTPDRIPSRAGRGGWRGGKGSNIGRAGAGRGGIFGARGCGDGARGLARAVGGGPRKATPTTGGGTGSSTLTQLPGPGTRRSAARRRPQERAPPPPLRLVRRSSLFVNAPVPFPVIFYLISVISFVLDAIKT